MIFTRRVSLSYNDISITDYHSMILDWKSAIDNQNRNLSKCKGWNGNLMHMKVNIWDDLYQPYWKQDIVHFNSLLAFNVLLQNSKTNHPMSKSSHPSTANKGINCLKWRGCGGGGYKTNGTSFDFDKVSSVALDDRFGNLEEDQMMQPASERAYCSNWKLYSFCIQHWCNLLMSVDV